MNKNVTFIVLFLSMLLIKSLALCQESMPKKEVMEQATYDNIKYVKYQNLNDESCLEHFIEGDNKKWDINYDIKLPAFLAYLNLKKTAKQFANETAKNYDSKWIKAILKRKNDTDVECFAKQDAVIHVSCNAQNHLLEREVEYLYISDPEMVNLFIGDSVFGKDSEEFFKKYGYTENYTSQGINIGYLSYDFSLTDSEETVAMNIHFKNDRVNGISCNFTKDLDLEKYTVDFKSFVSSKIPDGLFTKGFCVKYGTKLRENPSKSTIISKIDLDSEIYIIDFKEIEGKGTWVKLVTPEGIEGWTNGENISPNIHCFSEASRLNATLDYIFDLGLRFSDEEPIKVKKEKVNVLYFLKTKTFDGIEITELCPTSRGEDTENSEEDGEWVKLLITKPFIDILGLKVGDSIENLKIFTNKLSIVDWVKIDKNEIKNDGIYTWFKEEDGNYTKSINIKLEQGKISSIELVNLEEEY